MQQSGGAGAPRPSLRSILARTIVLVSAVAGLAIAAQSNAATIEGVVRGVESGTPIADARVWIVSPERSTFTGTDGSFSFRNLRAGTYALIASRLGYDTSAAYQFTLAEFDSVRTSITLKAHPIKGRDIVVIRTGDFESDAGDIGRIQLDVQAMRFAPGSLDDVSRSVARLPAVTPLYDVLNVYSVRGGSPMENGFFLDGIELPDISHLPNQGSTGGAVGLVKLDFIERARLHTGGMGASFGRRMSSEFDMEWRRPRGDRLHGEVNASVAGLDLMAEGPLSHRASIMLAARHSYLDRLLDNTSIPVSPRFNDYQGKFSVALADNHDLSVIGLLGVDNFDVSREQAHEAGYGAYYGEWDALPSAVGAIWEARWSERLASRTSLARTVASFDYHFLNIATRDEIFANRSTESTVTWRHDFRWNISEHRNAVFGVEWKRLYSHIRHSYYNTPDRYGRTPSRYFILDARSAENMPSAYAETTVPVWRDVEATIGIHTWYFSRSGHTHVEPRARLAWHPAESFSVELASGVYNQPLPENLVIQADAHRSLTDPQARHAVLGACWRPWEGVSARMELYRKWYTHMPMDPTVPRVYVLDELLARDVFRYAWHERLVAEGEAVSEGIEFLFSRTSAFGLYGDIGVSFSDARYRGLDGIWYERAIDVERGINMDIGYHSHNGWALAWSYRAVGGLRLTPFDKDLSYYAGYGVLDADRPGAFPLPEIAWMDIRVERRVEIGDGNLSAYIGVWNLTDQRALTTYLWSPEWPGVVYDVQLGRTPVLGLIYRR